MAVEVALDEADDEASLLGKVALLCGCAPGELPQLRLLKRSLDARRHRIRHRWLFEVGDGDARSEGLGGAPLQAAQQPERVMIVGDGPAGLFCAYQLARLGIASTVLERGKAVQPRRHDLKSLNRHGRVDADSNYCFGEGGAGTYSDGKLYTRSHKRGSVRDVLELLTLHGAPEDILTEARPHIGSNKLPRVVTRLRERLEEVGVQFRFGARVVDLARGPDGAVRGVRLASGEELSCERVVLATGHSAADVYEMLAELGVPLEPKSFAVGVRIEHPQALINRIQYGKAADHPRLRNAAYRIVHNVEGRGVFSFCMCPGGFIVPASTEPGGLVVNGMSLKRRDSPFANSGLVVQVDVSDVAAALACEVAVGKNALAGLRFQRRIEQAAFAAGGGGFVAPATRVSDFAEGRASSRAGDTSYIPGLRAGDMAEVLRSSGFDLATPLRVALARFGRDMPGYVSEEAQLIGVESRTSSPVRMPRDAETLQLVGLPGVFPSGEGAGYAGGIVSAAVDGMRVALGVAQSLGVDVGALSAGFSGG
ncbi:MAG: FAD-dependent oxidoreductase [Polyangiaceae bacterium]|nr:FAD-dependent oxidoreductase [Polyangiaceae bacterium]MCB9606936.1 FAD-dependent oxidoreductase [Polyangiaceae bacterium]